MRLNKKIHFEISERKILLRFMDVLFSILSLVLIDNFFEFNYFNFSDTKFCWAFVLGLYLNFFGTIFEMYQLQTANNCYQISKSIVLTTALTTLFYLLTPIFTPVLPTHRFQIILFFFTILVALFAWRLLYLYLLGSNRFVKKVLFIGNSKDIDRLVQDLITENPHYEVVGYIATDEQPKETKINLIEEATLKECIIKNFVSEIVVSQIKNKHNAVELHSKLLCILEKGIIIRQYKEVYESSTYRLPINFESKELYKFFPFSRSNHNKLYVYFSRFFDIIFSITGLSIFLFMIPFIWIVNFFVNRGSFFYSQERIGKNGIPFIIYKLRTMVKDAEKNGAVFATVNDSRITPFGKFLRKTRIDELPQFINVLKGDMAIIGPRPERQVFVDEISKVIPLYQTRHVIKPGLTGWAQVNYPYGASIEDSLMKLRYDLYYIKHRSVFLDFNIFLKTMSTILFFRGQ